MSNRTISPTTGPLGGAARSSWLLRTIDAVLVVIFGLIAVSPIGDAYGGGAWLVTSVGGLLLGTLVALIGLAARLGPWLTAVVGVGSYLLVGPALAVPDLATGRTLPNLDAEHALLTGAVDSWRESLTLIPPLGSSGTVLIVPFIATLVAGLLASTLLWRSRWPGAAGFVVVGLFGLAAAFGDSLTGHKPALARGIVLVIGLVVWLRWRSIRHVRARWSRRIALTAALVAVAGAAGAGLSVATESAGTRQVIRDHVEPPFDPLDYPSPLSRFRTYVKDLKPTTLFTVEGIEPKSKVRLATMDTFDGVVWNVSGTQDSSSASGTFSRLRRTKAAPTGARATVTVENYTGVWVPTIGETRSVTVLDRDGKPDSDAGSHVLYNGATGTMAQVGGVSPGMTYQLDSVFPAHPTDDEIAAAAAAPVVLPPPKDVPEQLTKRAQRWMNEGGATSGGALAMLLRDKFREGYYSDGLAGQVTSPSGHGAKRIADLTTPADMVGNDEQYASAMGVAAQRQGLPARVVIGFVVPQSGEVKGKDMAAWVEVKLKGLGWVAFAPTPSESRSLLTQTKKPDPEPQPQVLQPPIVPQEPEDAGTKIPQGQGEKSGFDLWALISRILGYVWTATKVVLLLSPVWGLLLVKRWRRKRRRRATNPVVRLSGGWKEITDRARDLGTRLPRSNTRYESSLVLAERFPASDAALLATVADRHVFGPAAPTDEDATAYWLDVETALKRMRNSVSWWRRPLAVLSPASIPWARVRDDVVSRTRSRINHWASSRLSRHLRDFGRATLRKVRR